MVQALTVYLMQHKGIQYQVVQTANPTAWKWAVHLDGGRSQTGVSFSRQYAIYDATNAIEKTLNEKALNRGA